MRNAGQDRSLIDQIELFHPMLRARLPQRDGIANAFDWVSTRRPIETKYGDAISDVRKLYDEISPVIAA